MNHHFATHCDNCSIFTNFYHRLFPIYDADLRKEAADKNTIDLGNGVIGFKFHNVTKYYENDIVFLSHQTKHVNSVPVELLDRVEGLIVYFDSDNVRNCTFQIKQ